MFWFCPKCKLALDNFKCKKCGFEATIQKNIFDFTFDLTEQELAEEAYRKKENLTIERILTKKKSAVRYYLVNIKKHVRLKGKILDLGAGYCWLGGLISQNPNVSEVWCADVSKKALEIGYRIAAMKKYRIAGFVRTSALNLPFPDNYFDYVISSAFLHHLVNLHSVLEEIRRVVKPQGIYYAFLEPASSFLAMPCSRSKIKKAHRDHPGVLENVYTFRQWKRFFQKYKTSFTLTPPMRIKWYGLWRLFKNLGLIQYLFFSNILIKAKF